MSTKSQVIREGVSAGLIGAVVIALWFALLDAMRGEMFATPIMLGTALDSLFLGDASAPSPAAAFISYTLFHFLAFTVAGIIFSYVVNAAETTPSAFIGFAGLFVAFEVAWIGMTTVLSQSAFGNLSWLQVGAANLIAAAAMGYYMWRQHPALPKRIGAVLAGAAE